MTEASATPRPIEEVALELGLDRRDLIHCGREAVKVEASAFERPAHGAGRLILVSAMSPTTSGEGKTVTSIGLAMGLSSIGRRAAVCLREPSLGPVFGRKGGGTGGGQARVVPSQSIDLHFTGDLHAVTSAHNLLAALIDNDLHFRQSPLDPRRVSWRRVLDMNDRALRDVVTGLGERSGGVPRETGFDITAASEVLAILGLANGEDDLRARLERIVVGRGGDNRFVTAGDVGAARPMALLLRDALLPNLVQTRSGTPAFVHGGAFANVAHGCSSLAATRLALRYADDVVTEAGFAFELGGEKFLHIKCPAGGLWPRAVVLVATLKALAEHGIENLLHHVGAARQFGLEPVVALNVFPNDAEADLAGVEAELARGRVRVERFTAFRDGAAGGEALARAVAEAVDAGDPPTPRRMYELDAPYAEKLRALATGLYNAADVVIETRARRALRRFTQAGFGRLPVCVAKTPFSLSDVASRKGVPSGYTLHVRDARLSAGAGFVVALTGTVETMPGLPKDPEARRLG